MREHEKVYQTFCDNTKLTFYVNAFAILIIFICIIGPIQLSSFTNISIRFLLVALLSYSLYINIISSQSLWNIDNIFTNSNLATVRNNFLLNSVFSLFIFVFILYIIIDFFYSQSV